MIESNRKSLCDVTLLQRSLSDQLSQQQEEQLTSHLSYCDVCRGKLESFAGDHDNWQRVCAVLRNETSGEHSSSASPTSLIPNPHLSNPDDGEFYEGAELKPSDFIVDYLQPAESTESLGRLANIEIRGFIGQGAHGIVLKGFQAELNRLVAVKVMAPHLASVVAARKRFAREARATAAITHPNVMPILQVDSSGQLPFLVMPYVDCESLQQRLDRDGAMQLSDVLRITLQVARGLAAAHAQGLVHRDVKPANILLERGVERVMLTDFGLARAVDDATLTHSGLIAGTPHYMSPEQARGDTVDVRSDLFSLGSVVYAISTGRPPFRAETTYGILRRVTDDEPRSLCELNSELPRWLECVTMKLLQKSAEDRFESAERVAELFEGCLAHCQQPQAFRLPAEIESLLPRSRTKRLQRRLVVGGLIALFALTLSAITLWANQIPHSAQSQASDSLRSAPTASSPSTDSSPKPSAWQDGVDESLRDLETDLETLLKATELP